MSKVFIPALTMGCDAHRPVSAKVPFIPPFPSFPPLRESRGVAKTTVTGLLRFCGTLPGTHGWIDPTQKEHPKNVSIQVWLHVFCLCSKKAPSIGITAILLRCIFPHRQVHFEDIGIGAQVILGRRFFFRRGGRLFLVGGFNPSEKY